MRKKKSSNNMKNEWRRKSPRWNSHVQYRPSTVEWFKRRSEGQGRLSHPYKYHPFSPDFKTQFECLNSRQMKSPPSSPTLPITNAIWIPFHFRISPSRFHFLSQLKMLPYWINLLALNQCYSWTVKHLDYYYM
jgi:hypothetical protein